jgi:hypothetical protein
MAAKKDESIERFWIDTGYVCPYGAGQPSRLLIVRMTHDRLHDVLATYDRSLGALCFAMVNFGLD